MEAFMQEYGQAEILVPNESDIPLFSELLPKYQSWEWNYGASPLGSGELSRRFPWGGVQISYQILAGRAQSVRVFTDSMDETLAPRLEQALTGCPWRGDALAHAALSIGEEDISRWLSETL